MIELTSGVNDAGRRLDRVLRKALPDHPLSLIHRLLRQKKVMVNKKHAKANTVIQAGDVIQIKLQVNGKYQQVNKKISVNEKYQQVNEKISVNGKYARVNKRADSHSLHLPEIIWQNSEIIVFNKPPGLATHGANSLDTIVKSCLAAALSPSLSFRPGPLHRLDKQTSGAIAFSKTLEGARVFSRLLREQKLVKTYLAIVEGRICKEEIWQDELVRDKYAQKTFTGNGKDAKNAVTKVKPLAFNSAYTLIETEISTGRTHQIRVQSAAHGHPLAGDIKYGGKRFNGGFYLHAWKIEFNAFSENDSPNFPKLIIAPVPESFKSRLVMEFGLASTDIRLYTAHNRRSYR